MDELNRSYSMHQGDLPGSFPLSTAGNSFWGPFLGVTKQPAPTFVAHGWMGGHFILSVFTIVVLWCGHGHGHA
jgi:hypothetical protein